MTLCMDGRKWSFVGLALFLSLGWVLVLPIQARGTTGGLEAPAALEGEDLPLLRLSLREAIHAAVDNNPTVQLFKERVQEALGTQDARRGPLLPHLSGNLSGARRTFFSGTFNLTGSRVTGPFNVYDARGFLSQSLFNLSLIQQWRAARTGVEVAELDAEATRLDTMAMVGLLYTDALRANAAVGASEANLTLSTQLLELARDRKEAGLAIGLDVTRAQVQVENEKQRWLVAKNSAARAGLTLIRALGIDFAVRLEFTDDLALVDVMEPSSHHALATARGNRVELAAQRRREKLAALTLSSVTSERIPSLSFNGGYGVIGREIGVLDSTWTGSLQLSVPIFDGGQREGRIAAERSRVRQEHIRTKDLSDQITLEVRDALLTLSSTRQQVQVAEQGLTLALRELDLSRERFAVGVANNVEVTNAQTSVARARDQVIEGLANFHAARINLARAQGQLDELF